MSREKQPKNRIKQKGQRTHIVFGYLRYNFGNIAQNRQKSELSLQYYQSWLYNAVYKSQSWFAPKWL